jgi:hypothetical protein
MPVPARPKGLLAVRASVAGFAGEHALPEEAEGLK